jgi:hypothetical protein
LEVIMKRVVELPPPPKRWRRPLRDLGVVVDPLAAKMISAQANQPLSAPREVELESLCAADLGFITSTPLRWIIGQARKQYGLGLCPSPVALAVAVLPLPLEEGEHLVVATEPIRCSAGDALFALMKSGGRRVLFGQSGRPEFCYRLQDKFLFIKERRKIE